MSSKEALKILHKIGLNPSMADQYTEEEIETLEYIALEKDR